MLGVHRLTTGGAEYYLADLAQELPLPPGSRRRGEDGGPAAWSGRAAEGLGLRGAIDPDQLRAVLDGRHPTAGHRLRSERATVLGFDLTFSAPKSASVVFALGGEEAARHVVAAHAEGVQGALRYLESHALSARRGSGEEREILPTTGLVAASFTHGVNRNLDPHLHTHVVMANMVHGLDGRWGACDHRGLSAHRAAASAVYESHLRARLSAGLGVRWVGTPGLRAEVRGVSPHLMGEFSSRGADIRRHMAAHGAHSARGARVAWAATRPAKSGGLDFGELSSQWDRRARSFGDPRAEMAAVLAPRPARPPARTVDEHRFGATLSLAPDGAARRRDVVAAFGAAAVDGADERGLEQLTQLWTPPLSERAQVGVAEDSRTLRSVVPGGHLLATLGPRPLDPADHGVWRTAARAIDDYRAHWGVKDGRDALGGDALPSGIASLPTARLIEHLQTARHIEAARQRLGWRPARTHEMDRGR
jgi:conjugative relaxase-like TrwC/TraI family protein